MHNPPRIIGLGGTNGSGKDTIGQFLASQYGYLFVSVSEILRDELRERSLPVNRENLRELSAEWRRESGHLGALIDKAVEVYEKTPGEFIGLAIASLRNPGEVDRVHELNGKVIWVDADPRVRYGRIQASAGLRQRKGEDNKTFEQFQAEEQVEMNKQAGGDDTSLNMTAVKEKSDAFINNDGSELAALQDSIKEVLRLN